MLVAGRMTILTGSSPFILLVSRPAGCWLVAARQLQGVDWLEFAASDVITSCCYCKSAAAFGALFAACYNIDHQFLVVVFFVQKTLLHPWSAVYTPPGTSSGVKNASASTIPQNCLTSSSFLYVSASPSSWTFRHVFCVRWKKHPWTDTSEPNTAVIACHTACITQPGHKDMIVKMYTNLLMYCIFVQCVPQ